MRPKVPSLHFLGRWPALAAGLCLLLVGCGSSNPLDARITANDALGFSLWRAQHDSSLSPDQREMLDKALQEMRFHIMSAEETSGAEFIQATLMEEVDGRTVREVIQMGLGWELSRAKDEWTALKTGMERNARFRTKPGDTDSVDYLALLRERQATRLKAAADEIELTQSRLLAVASGSPDPDGR